MANNDSPVTISTVAATVLCETLKEVNGRAKRVAYGMHERIMKKIPKRLRSIVKHR